MPRAIRLIDLGPVSALGQHVQLAARNQALHQDGALGDGAAILGAPEQKRRIAQTGQFRMKRLRRPKRQASAMGGVVLFIPILVEVTDQFVGERGGIFQDELDSARVFSSEGVISKGRCHGPGGGVADAVAPGSCGGRMVDGLRTSL